MCNDRKTLQLMAIISMHIPTKRWLHCTAFSTDFTIAKFASYSQIKCSCSYIYYLFWISFSHKYIMMTTFSRSSVFPLSLSFLSLFLSYLQIEYIRLRNLCSTQRYTLNMAHKVCVCVDFGTTNMQMLVWSE